eukprot:scaffold3701_cov77-Skeletonema_marinoi.AAC.7
MQIGGGRNGAEEVTTLQLQSPEAMLAALFSLREALSTFTEGGVAALSLPKFAAADFLRRTL